MEIACTDHMLLRSFAATDAATLLDVVNANRESLDHWVRWADALRSLEGTRGFVDRTIDMEAEGRGFHLGIWRGEILLGGVPCWSIDRVHRVAELGYWLSAEARGQGLAMRATRAVVEHLFTAEGLNRIEFQCRVENLPSRQLAERLGGQLEGIRRQSHWVNGAFRDHAVYALLASDPRPTD